LDLQRQSVASAMLCRSGGSATEDRSDHQAISKDQSAKSIYLLDDCRVPIQDSL
jgi:hypothetical protein